MVGRTRSLPFQDNFLIKLEKRKFFLLFSYFQALITSIIQWVKLKDLSLARKDSLRESKKSQTFSTQIFKTTVKKCLDDLMFFLGAPMVSPGSP